MNTVNTDSSALVREVTITKGQWSVGILRWLKNLKTQIEFRRNEF